jgi:YVTN family beta-propeller protein
MKQYGRLVFLTTGSFFRGGIHILLLLLSVLAVAPCASAQATYTYTGSPDTACYGAYTMGVPGPSAGPCLQSLVVTGYFTVPQTLAPNVSNDILTPSAFSFTDDASVSLGSTSALAVSTFVVSTDANGHITNFNIILETGNTDPSAGCQGQEEIIDISQLSGYSCYRNQVAPSSEFGSAAYNVPGTWSSPLSPASAQRTTYSYVGNAYNQFGGTFACPPVCGIKGSFTVAAPLAADANYYFSPSYFSFTDGITTFTPSNVTASAFGVVTNSFGQIIGWNMDWLTPGDEMFSGTNPPGCVGCSVVDGSFNPSAFAELPNSPGTWTVSTSMGPFAYVPSLDEGIVTVYDTALYLPVATIPVGAHSDKEAISPAGTSVYVANNFGNSVSVIDTATSTVVATIPVGTGPDGVAFSPDGSLIYVANNANAIIGNSISVINAASGAVVSSIPTGINPSLLAVTPDGKFIYVTFELSNYISVINTETQTVVANVIVGPNPFDVAISPDGKFAYVTVSRANSVVAIATSTNTISATIPVGAIPLGISLSRDGTTAYVSNAFGGNISVVNLASNSVVATVSVGAQPNKSALTPDGAFLWTVNDNSPGNITVIQTSNNVVVSTFPVNDVTDVVIGSVSQSATQLLSPTAPNQFNFGSHSFTVQYPAGTNFSGVNMTVVAAQPSQGTFRQRVAGTAFANATCIVYSGAGGNCVDYQVTCSTLSGSAISCPSTSTPSITVKTSFDTPQQITNPGFLTAPIGTNQWENIFTSFFLQRVDPTVKGHTTGFSEFFAVDLGATNAQGAGMLQILPPLSKTSVFRFGHSIPVKFQLTSVAQPGLPVTDAIAGITVVMLTDLAGNPTPKIVLDEPSAFVYHGGAYHYKVSTTGYAPGVYNLTIYGNAFVAHQVQFTIAASKKRGDDDDDDE